MAARGKINTRFHHPIYHSAYIRFLHFLSQHLQVWKHHFILYSFKSSKSLLAKIIENSLEQILLNLCGELTRALETNSRNVFFLFWMPTDFFFCMRSPLLRGQKCRPLRFHDAKFQLRSCWTNIATYSEDLVLHHWFSSESDGQITFAVFISSEFVFKSSSFSKSASSTQLISASTNSIHFLIQSKLILFMSFLFGNLKITKWPHWQH